MVLIPAGAMLGKALLDKMPRNGAQVARISRMLSDTSALRENWKPRPRPRASNPFAKQEYLLRAGGTGIRNLSNKKELGSPEHIDDWVGVYRYPGIRNCQMLARAKFVQTVASVTYLPYSSYQYSIGAVDSTWYYSTAALAIAAPILLAIFSRYINRLIGVIAISEDNKWVRVGYLTFWGRRKNKYIRLDDVLPITETGNSEKDTVMLFTWYSGGGDYLFLPIDKCEILDQERAELLFGNTKFLDAAKTKVE